mgnify:FL=1
MNKKVVGVAAIIIKENRVLALRRNYGKFKGFYEFVGGKIETGESDTEALKREVQEEIGITLFDIEYFDTLHHPYDTFELELRMYTAKPGNEEIQLRVHDDLLWVSSDQLYSVNWIEADIQLLPKLTKFLEFHKESQVS